MFTQSTVQPSAQRMRPGLGQARAARRQRARQAARARIHMRVVYPIDTPHLLPDPLQHPSSFWGGLGNAVRMLFAAGLLHVWLLAIFFAAGRLFGDDEPPLPPRPERVQVVITEPPEEPPLQLGAEDAEGPAVVEPELPSEPEPEPEPKPKPRPSKKPRPKVAEVEPAPADLVPDPLAAAASESAVEPAQPQPRLRVGLDLGSTVEGGAGPAFAVGNTRMGSTPETASSPEPSPETATAVAGNRVATRLPTKGQAFVRPRRLSAPERNYPPLLRRQGIEADVVLMVTIGISGQVQKVEVVRGAPQPAFNEAAVRAARQSRWTPAKRGGAAIVTSQRYTVRFRLND